VDTLGASRNATGSEPANVVMWVASVDVALVLAVPSSSGGDILGIAKRVQIYEG
jgi:hypothetical protein